MQIGYNAFYLINSTGTIVDSYLLLERIAWILLLPVFIGILVLAAGRILGWFSRTQPLDFIKPDQKVRKFPYISIHIPVCNEPPELVIATIKSCLAQQYNAYEVIILCNNTTDEKLWKPIENFCSFHQDKVTFIQVDRLEGYKAGALDLCRSLSNRQTEYIFTVDADYVLKPYALKIAARHLSYPKAQIIQFPQSYQKEEYSQDEALREELDSYFNIFSTMGNSKVAALPTGTLSLVNVKALDRVGGWSARSITEDAELGLKFLEAGYHTFFVPQVIGEGHLPQTIGDLKKQRARWVFGNVQALLNGFKSGFLFRNLQTNVLLQLTAWINFLALPTVFLILKVLFLSAGIGGSSSAILYGVLACFYTYVGGQFVLLGLGTGFEVKKWMGAFLVRLALTSVGTFGWLGAIAGLKKPFKCTNKFKKQMQLKDLPLVFPLLFFTSFIVCIAHDHRVGYLFLILGLLYCAASLTLYRQFKMYTKSYPSIQPQKI